MIYPSNFEQKIGFSQIREMLSEACLSPLGRRFVERVSFLDRFDLVQRLLQQTHEFANILRSGEDFPSSYYFDATEHLSRASLEGAFLEVRGVFEVKMSLRAIRQALGFFVESEEGEYPALKALTEGVEVDRSLVAALEKLVDDNGNVKDDASPELQRVKRDLIGQQTQLRKTINSILRQAKNEGWTPGDAEPTIRGGRLVIPVIAEYKRRIKGLIHDESATGQTVYLEPESVFELNNDIKDLENAYHRELIRLLTAVTNQVRHHLPGLRKAYQFLALLDFIRAKSVVANKLGAIMPELQKRPVMKWKNARHPILHLTLQAQGKKAVPLSLELDQEQRILLISGPNAGGKSVAMKTAGLLQYMLQCGLLIPVEEGSEAGLFGDIFLDMGDEQSIENDLSTYSSHLQNMKQFVLLADKKSLVLIDEFGTGTEPALGGAIAEAVLGQLHHQKVFGVITTHYTNLKNFAEKNEGIVNGAMRYNPAELQPLYQLEIGKPGSSFALEIARKIGLPKNIIDRAGTLVGKEKIRYDKLLEQLEQEKTDLERRNAAAAKHERKLQKQVEEYTALKQHLEESKQDIIRTAKGQAKLLLKDANQQIESTIEQIKRSQADKEQTKAARQELDTFREKLTPEPKPVYKRNGSVPTGPLQLGERVALIGQDSVGELLAIKGKTAEVSFGGLKTIVKLEKLERPDPNVVREKVKKEKELATAVSPSKGLDVTQRMADFQYTLDVRGQRAEEALTTVMNFMDDAIMLGMPEVKIIHGRGNGILKMIIRDYVRTLREVASVADEHVERGGDGVSIIVLK
ncbi:endonuclease MutS2 [Rufibacter sp. XAAS-G3-1]|uniref:endonuclease MutS2 n=1 Tax=Rufibacter sp. XAAS-G3-1 TaxID=2729134 RepID=UPI0015E6FA4A|nr:Smr/MutS family protein [Rufibacter sp. XAAS-G3-1]